MNVFLPCYKTLTPYRCHIHTASGDCLIDESKHLLQSDFTIMKQSNFQNLGSRQTLQEIYNDEREMPYPLKRGHEDVCISFKEIVIWFHTRTSFSSRIYINEEPFLRCGLYQCFTKRGNPWASLEIKKCVFKKGESVIRHPGATVAPLQLSFLCEERKIASGLNTTAALITDWEIIVADTWHQSKSGSSQAQIKLSCIVRPSPVTSDWFWAKCHILSFFLSDWNTRGFVTKLHIMWLQCKGGQTW